MAETNAYYRVETSTDLLNWDWQSYFFHTNDPATQYVPDPRPSISQYFRARQIRTNWYVMNNSLSNTCPEFDNVHVAIRTNVPAFLISATPPTDYVVSNNICGENWTGCPDVIPITDYYQGPGLTNKVYDIGSIYLIVNRKEWFWRPQGMTVTVNGTNAQTNITYIEVGGRDYDTADSYPIYCAQYADGNIRLIPFPPTNSTMVCMGSSVLVGPATVSARPHADIQAMDYNTTHMTLFVTYRTGGTATIGLYYGANTVAAELIIYPNYATDKSLCIFQSMFVADGNSDCDRVAWTDSSNAMHEDPILSFSGSSGTRWLFKRHVRSIQRESAPEITIDLCP